jgi:hypothetical protein
VLQRSIAETEGVAAGSSIQLIEILVHVLRNDNISACDGFLKRVVRRFVMLVGAVLYEARFELGS